jgi:hypothetical protein
VSVLRTACMHDETGVDMIRILYFIMNHNNHLCNNFTKAMCVAAVVQYHSSCRPVTLTAAGIKVSVTLMNCLQNGSKICVWH